MTPWLYPLKKLTPHSIPTLPISFLTFRRNTRKPSKVQEKPYSQNHGDESAISVAKHEDGSNTKTKQNRYIAIKLQYTYTPRGELLHLPNAPLFNALLGFAERAKNALDALDDQYQEVMAYQAFDEFAADIDDIAKRFIDLFLILPHEAKPDI